MEHNRIQFKLFFSLVENFSGGVCYCIVVKEYNIRNTKNYTIKIK